MCDILLSKSDQNFKAGELIITLPNDYHATSIHCFYYSLFQLLKYIGFKKFNLSEQVIDEKRKNGKETYQKTEHDVVFFHVYNQLRNSERFLSMDLKSAFYELKTLRADADYHEIIITPEASGKAKEKVEKTINGIKNKLGL